MHAGVVMDFGKEQQIEISVGADASEIFRHVLLVLVISTCN